MIVGSGVTGVSVIVGSGVTGVSVIVGSGVTGVSVIVGSGVTGVSVIVGSGTAVGPGIVALADPKQKSIPDHGITNPLDQYSLYPRLGHMLLSSQ